MGANELGQIEDELSSIVSKKSNQNEPVVVGGLEISLEQIIGAHSRGNTGILAKDVIVRKRILDGIRDYSGMTSDEKVGFLCDLTLVGTNILPIADLQEIFITVHLRGRTGRDLIPEDQEELPELSDNELNQLKEDIIQSNLEKSENVSHLHLTLKEDRMRELLEGAGNDGEKFRQQWGRLNSAESYFMCRSFLYALYVRRRRKHVAGLNDEEKMDLLIHNLKKDPIPSPYTQYDARTIRSSLDQ